jgi:hypothetical protein
VLRALVLALLLANLGWFAWTRGWLPDGWLPPAGDAAQREPQRLDRQVRPDAVALSPYTAAPASAPASAPAATASDDRICVQAGPLRAEDWPGLTAALARAGIAPDAWQRVPAAAAVPGGTAAASAVAGAATGAGGDWLRLPAADAALRQRLPSLAWPGLVFLPCP